MIWLRRPWGLPAPLEAGRPSYVPEDCLMVEADPAEVERRGVATTGWRKDGGRVARGLLPYPADGRSLPGATLAGFPARWPSAREPEGEEEERAALPTARMKSLIARLHEVEEALDEPADFWPRLARAWARAAEEDRARLSEIVRQSREGEMPRTLQLLEPRIRRVLRRVSELTPLSRVEELDRKAMIWLSRQPGTTLAERAGSRQRMMATVRQESFDTVENRVLHAYARTAMVAARTWMRENARARLSRRFAQVREHDRRCARIARALAGLGVAVAAPGATPNYVLTQDPQYRETREAWLRLLREEHQLDGYWAWQAQTWIDFVALAVVLSLLGLPGARLVVQSPVVWLAEPERGRWFEQDNPLAIVWLPERGRVIEVQSRPDGVSRDQGPCGAPLWLRSSDVGGGVPARLPVWPRHRLVPGRDRGDLDGAAAILRRVRTAGGIEAFGGGLVVLPGFESTAVAGGDLGRSADGRVAGVAIDVTGGGLARGLAALGDAVARLIEGLPP